MTSSSITVAGRYNLLALHRGLLEARFCDVANDADVSYSPILAKMHRDVVERLIAEGGNEQAWLAWLEISPDRREWSVALGRAKRFPRWSGLSEHERGAFVRNLLSPFRVTDDLLVQFLCEVNTDH